MANPFMTMEAANLFAGAEPSDVTPSNHLTLAEVKLPSFDEQYADHRAGGAPVAVEVDTVFARLECTFSLAGWTPQVATLIASWLPVQNQFYVYGVIRDRASGVALEAAAEMHGRLGRADPQNWRRGDLGHWAYAIRGLTYYKLVCGDSEMYEWDFMNNTFRVGGEDRNADLNVILKTGQVGIGVPLPQPAPV